ncbi:MAG: V-type ATP synthase subunit A, partial [Clostridiales bacterium]|nr:V-type ATP synthase subunit A [Clostridiales bacterium]
MPEKYGEIYGINGPVLTVKTKNNFHMSETVLVTEERLIGEVINIRQNEAVVQVFEDTSGLRAGEKVYPTGARLSVTLGPGIIGNIFDGIQRPLKAIEAASGTFISRGVHVDSLDGGRKWPVRFTAKAGAQVKAGCQIAETPETSFIVNKIMIPPDISGRLEWLAPDGEYTVNEPVAIVRDTAGMETTITMAQKWPIRAPRPV